MPKALQDILVEYDEKKDLYADYCDKMFMLICDILAGMSFHTYDVTKRVKDRDSLSTKISKEGKSYSILSDVTDVAGVRIISFFSDDVDKISLAISEQFLIDEERSIDKRKLLDPDRFGYLSLHYIISLNDARVSLPEYSRFSGLWCELQIRSILQHSWAEIEHDLGYKTKEAIPTDIRRSFSRLAGLLELADIEFSSIRSRLGQYKDAVKEQVEANPGSVDINKDSLNYYITTNSTVLSVENEMARHVNAVSFVPYDEDTIEDFAKRCTFFDIRNIGTLSMAISANASNILYLFKGWVVKEEWKEIRNGISIFYLFYLLIGMTGSVSAVVDFFNEFEISADHSDAEKLVAICSELNLKVRSKE